MAQGLGRADGITEQRCGQQPERTEAVVVAAAQIRHLVDRYIAAQRLVLTRFSDYGTATGRAAFASRLDQLEALVRETSVTADAIEMAGSAATSAGGVAKTTATGTQATAQ